MTSLTCTLADCMPAYILASLSLLWNAYHEWLIYHAKQQIPLLVGSPIQPIPTQ